MDRITEVKPYVYPQKWEDDFEFFVTVFGLTDGKQYVRRIVDLFFARGMLAAKEGKSTLDFLADHTDGPVAPSDGWNIWRDGSDGPDDEQGKAEEARQLDEDARRF